MALRVTADNVLKENFTSKLASKTTMVKPLGQVHGRTALEVVNANQKIANFDKKVPFKKALPPPVVKKPQIKEIVPIKGAQSNQLKTKPCFKRQESIPQNILTKVEETHKDSYSSKQIVNISDPDADDKNEPLMATEYVLDIFSYLRELENAYPIEKNYLEGHQTTPKMRCILINWLVQVHLEFKLYLETLHMCVSIIDRYLQINRNVGKRTLQLVGTTALFIASKYEEMYLPQVDDFVEICDDTYTKRQILQMEIDILKRLDFNLGKPLSVHFLRRFSKVAGVNPDQYILAKYLLELALLEYDMCHLAPSILAAAACCLSVAVCKEVLDMNKEWTPTLVHYTGYKYTSIKPVILSLASAVVKSESSLNLKNIKQKYANVKYLKISVDYRLQGTLIKKLASTKKQTN